MKFLCVLLFAAAAMAAEIPKGAHVLLRLENSVNTRTAQKGDFVYLRTAVPIANAGVIAVPAGSYVQGVVSDARRSGRVKGRAQLAIRLETLTLASGKVYKFAPHLSAVDAGETGQKVVGGRERHRAGAQPGPGCRAHRNPGGQRSRHWGHRRPRLERRWDRHWRRVGRGAGHRAAHARQGSGAAAGIYAGCGFRPAGVAGITPSPSDVEFGPKDGLFCYLYQNG